MPKATRNYNSVGGPPREAAVEQLDALGSYTWSRDAGNYSGLSSVGRERPRQPEQLARLRLSVDVVRQTGKVLDGVFDTDRTHQIKAQVLYLFKWGTSVGLNEFIASGTPITRQVPIIAGSNYPIRYLGRNSEGRTPIFSQTDLFVAAPFRIGGTRSLELQHERAEPVRPATVMSRVSTMRRSGAIPNEPGYYQEAAFYAGQLDFDQLIAKAVAAGLHDAQPAVRDGQHVPGADRRAVRREVHLLTGERIYNDAPRAIRPRGVFHFRRASCK